jgi:hypothetical protein
MAKLRSRGASIFPGLLLLYVGVMLLLHNYRGLSIGYAVWRWWPLILVVWGVVKLYERSAAARSGNAGSVHVGGGEIALVIGLLALLGVVAGVEYIRQEIPEIIKTKKIELGDRYDYDFDVPAKAVPPDARISIRAGRGDISVRSSDEAQVRISGKKYIRAWSESEADRVAPNVSAEVVPNGDGYEIRPSGSSGGDSRVSLDMEITVPKNASLVVRGEKGDVTVTDLSKPLSINTLNGDIEVRENGGDVTIDNRHGDIKVSDTKGNVKISGHGGEINVAGSSGGLTIEGEFYGPIRADKIAKGVRFISSRTDMTLSQLSGHMETGSGNMEIVDAQGNLSLRTNSYDVIIENATGKVKVDNRNGHIELRSPAVPKEDIELSNSSAGIDLSLPENSSFEIVADCHSCDIDSEFSGTSLNKTSLGSDSSHLEGRYGNGRGPKITLKTSYGSITLRKTSSEMPVLQTPVHPLPPKPLPPAPHPSLKPPKN